MSYTAGEALILTRVQALSGFSSANTSRADWSILNKGKAGYYAILRPGEFSIEWITFTNYLARWTTVIELWQKYTDDVNSKPNLYARVNTLLSGFQAYPHLGAGANSGKQGTISGGPEPTEQWRASGGPMFLRWNVIVSWWEEVQVTYSE